jgi:hypothetical protein
MIGILAIPAFGTSVFRSLPPTIVNLAMYPEMTLASGAPVADLVDFTRDPGQDSFGLEFHFHLPIFRIDYTCLA